VSASTRNNTTADDSFQLGPHTTTRNLCPHADAPSPSEWTRTRAKSALSSSGRPRIAQVRNTRHRSSAAARVHFARLVDAKPGTMFVPTRGEARRTIGFPLAGLWWWLQSLTKQWDSRWWGVFDGDNRKRAQHILALGRCVLNHKTGHASPRPIDNEIGNLQLCTTVNATESLRT
jgi:hypothetical protein